MSSHVNLKIFSIRLKILLLIYRKYALNNLICSIKAVFNGKDLPSESKMVAIFQHKVQFMEVLSESIPQVALHCLVLSQFGLNTTSIWSASSQLLSLVTSLISICLAFGKVSRYLIIYIRAGFCISIFIILYLATSIPKKQGNSWHF